MPNEKLDHFDIIPGSYETRDPFVVNWIHVSTKVNESIDSRFVKSGQSNIGQSKSQWGKTIFILEFPIGACACEISNGFNLPPIVSLHERMQGTLPFSIS